MYGKKKTIVEVDRFGLISGRRKLLDGYRVYIEIFLQVENVFRPGFGMSTQDMAPNETVFMVVCLKMKCLYYTISNMKKLLLVDYSVSKKRFPSTMDSWGESCRFVSVGSIRRARICSAGSQALRRLPWRIPCFPPSPAMPPLAPGGYDPIPEPKTRISTHT